VYVIAMVSKLDKSVGHIVHILMEIGMLNNSIIILIFDNGALNVGDFQNWLISFTIATSSVS
jgi:arylsulfatase A-like enzyme